jgi:hypothetical protein
MTIQIRDAELEARLQKQLEATGSNSLEELLLAEEPGGAEPLAFWKIEKESKPRYSVALTSLTVEREFLRAS